MKKIALIVTMLFAIGACESETEYGRCIGAFDTPREGLVYEASVRNIVLGAVFFQTLFAPALVIFKEARCPVERKVK